ncbi:MAG: protein O-mannosyl-transferase family [Planctomycetota bacterium]
MAEQGPAESGVWAVSAARRGIIWLYLVVLSAGMVFYGLSCAPGSLWQDSGMYQYRVWHNDIEGGLGLALSHPLYHIIAIGVKYIPLGEFGYRINLISGLSAAVAVANICLLLRLWVGKTLPALIGAITLAVSWTFWQHASIAESYTLYAALFTAELIFLLQYFKSGRAGYLYLLGFFNGLAAANHLWAVIPLACYAVLLLVLLRRRRITAKDIVVTALLWMIGAWPYEYLIIKNMILTGDVTATLQSALFGNNWSDAVLNLTVSRRLVLENILFIGYNFPTPNILFFVAGASGLYKVSSDKRFAHVMLALLLLFFVFAFRYTVPDRYAFFIPFYCLASVFIGVGAHLFLKRRVGKVFAILVLLFAFLPLPVYGVVPRVAERLEIKIPTKRTIPYRNDYTYFLQPWQGGNRGAGQFAGQALASVDKGEVIIADGTTVYALWYVQEVENFRRDVHILSTHGDYENPLEFPNADTIKWLMAERGVYVVSPVKGYCPGFLLEGYDFEKAGVLYRVVERR